MTLTLTPHQQDAHDALFDFLFRPPGAFVLTGSAGTGKTTLLRAICESLEEEDLAPRLLAPTGRAARVLRRRTGFDARTAHSHLYVPEPLKDRPGVRLVRKADLGRRIDALIIDEASMVASRMPSDSQFLTAFALLDDLVDEALRNEAHLVFVGDPCQLPPVGEEHSVALRPDLLAERYGLTTGAVQLEEVMRQMEGSDVLIAATALRDALSGRPAPAPDLPRLPHGDRAVRHYLETIESEPRTNGDVPRAVMLAYTNRTVFDLNRSVRAELDLVRVLVPGDVVVTDRDAWAEGRLVPRAETYVVEDVQPAPDFAGLHFAEVHLTSAADDLPDVAGLALLETLLDPHGKLSPQQEMHLFSEAKRQNAVFRTSHLVWDDPFVSAIRLRYGHALTVHKAQGGEWEHVYLDPFVPRAVQPAEAIRWRYTALTRAACHCYLIGSSHL